MSVVVREQTRADISRAEPLRTNAADDADGADDRIPHFSAAADGRSSIFKWAWT
jgi:hypothetical protein